MLWGGGADCEVTLMVMRLVGIIVVAIKALVVVAVMMI